MTTPLVDVTVAIDPGPPRRPPSGRRAARTRDARFLPDGNLLVMERRGAPNGVVAREYTPSGAGPWSEVRSVPLKGARGLRDEPGAPLWRAPRRRSPSNPGVDPLGEAPHTHREAATTPSMDASSLERYQRELGLRPVFIHQLMTGDGVQTPWRVAAVERGACAVLGFDEEGALIERRARTGALPVAVGDWVLLAHAEQDSAQVERVLERVTWLQRGSSHREGQGQLIAANLDTVFIVAAFAETDKLERRSLRARRLDRFISAVKEGGATPVVVLNKVDLTDREEDELAALRAELRTRLGGVDVLCAAALEHRGLDALAERLVPGDTVAFIGPSGVGKSSLINALLGRESQSVGGVRARDTKGRHTTTRRELSRMPSGALLIDTPGVREFAVVSDERVAGFEDIDALAQRCRFSDCGHGTEPGCAVRAAVEALALPAERLESYRDLERDAQRLRGRQDAYARHLEHLEQRKFGRVLQRAKELKDKT